MTQSSSDSPDNYTGIFNDSYPPILDGVTLTVQNYARVFDEMGLNPYVVTPWNPVKVPAHYPVTRYFSLPIRSRHPYRYGYPKLDFAIWRRLRNIPFRIIHSHSPFSAGRLGVYAARHHDIPLIGTFHSKYRSDLEHSFKHTPWMVPIIMKRILDFFNACDEVWIPQASVEPTVREYGFEGNLTVVENGNDLAGLYPECNLPQIKADARRQLGIADDCLSLLFVGQHIREKGILIIADALHMLKGVVPFEMHFIGTGYALNELKDTIDRYGLAGQVKIHGMLADRNLLARHYAAADLFLFPSFYDNAPLVVREAAAMGTPSILIKDSTAAEVITDGVNGFLTQRTPENYAALIKSLYSNHDRISLAAHNARQTLIRTWDDVVAEVANRYDEAIARHNMKNK